MLARAFWHLLCASAREWWNDNSFRFAAALAFYTIFSLAPIIVIATSIAGVFVGEEVASEHMTRQIQELVGPQGGNAVREVAESAGRMSGGVLTTILGILTLLIGSTMVFAELQADLNQIWDVKVDPHPTLGLMKRLIRSRLQSFMLVLGVGFLLLVSLVISAAIEAAHMYLDARVTGISWVWRLVNALTSLLVITLLFGMIYRYLPDVEVTWKDVAIGAVVSAVLFTIGKHLIGLYLGQMAFGASYGAAGSFAVLLIWVYYSALISFFGAEFTQVYTRTYGSRIRPEPHAVRAGAKRDEEPLVEEAAPGAQVPRESH